MQAPIPTVFIVDQDVSVHQSLQCLITSAGWRAEGAQSAELLLARPSVETPSCLLLDNGGPGLDGAEVQRRVSAERPEMPVIIITGHADIPMAVRAMKAGALGLLTKPLVEESVLGAVAEAFEVSRAVLRRNGETRLVRQRYQSLSLREREVMTLVVRGHLNKQVGAVLGITEITVKAHRGRVMRKMAANSLPDLVTMAASLPADPESAFRWQAPRLAPRLVVQSTSWRPPVLNLHREPALAG